MQPFKTFLQERFINLLPDSEDRKKQHADKVWELLQKAYKPIGGIHGSGFESKEDMIKNIPMWKLHKRNGQIKSVAMYKDKEGRKRVAIATDESEEGKRGLGHIMKADLDQERSHGEISGPSLSFLKKHVPDITKHAKTREEVRKLMPGEEIRAPKDDDPEVLKHPELKNHFYQRKIGATGDEKWHTKLLTGTPGNKITPKDTII